jgi:hypothetical protein
MHHFNPTTGELIVADNPAEWMGSTDKAPPAFDEKTEGVFFVDGKWAVKKSESGQDPAQRIAELKYLLQSTDYQVLPDYDKKNDEIKTQRQAWRDELRGLE